jgi:hypothetical protein
MFKIQVHEGTLSAGCLDSDEQQGRNEQRVNGFSFHKIVLPSDKRVTNRLTK